MGVYPIPPIPRKKEPTESQFPLEPDPKRNLKLIVRIVLLVSFVVILFVPVWEIGPSYEIVDTDVVVRSYPDGSNCTQYTVHLRDLGVGGWYRVEFEAGSYNHSRYWHLEPFETRSLYGTSCEVHIEEFFYAVHPPDGKPKKSVFQILVGL